MEPTIPLRYTKETATGPYSELHEFSPQPPSNFLHIHFSIIFPSTSKFPEQYSPLDFPTKPVPYILEFNPRPFYSFRGLKNQMRIRFAVMSWIFF